MNLSQASTKNGAATSPALHDRRIIGAGDDGAWRVQAGPWVLVARRAASCLVEPTVGDRVLVTVVGRDALVLGVLEREDPKAATVLACEGDVSLVSRSGRVALTAAESVALEAPAVTASATRITLAADAVDVAGRALSFVAAAAQLDLGAAKLVARTADAVLERLFVRADRSFRRVEGMEQVRAGQIDMAAQGPAMLRGEHTVVDATGLVKVDGAQVHIG